MTRDAALRRVHGAGAGTRLKAGAGRKGMTRLAIAGWPGGFGVAREAFALVLHSRVSAGILVGIVTGDAAEPASALRIAPALRPADARDRTQPGSLRSLSRKSWSRM